MPLNRRAKLSDHIAKTASKPIGAANYIIWDEAIPGFGLRVGATTRTWFVSYRLASGKQRRLKIGPLSATGADEARKRAKAEIGKVAGGGDPAKELETQRRRSKSRIEDLLTRYLKAREHDRVVAAKQEVGALRLGFGPKLLQVDLSELDRRQLIDVMNRVAVRVAEEKKARDQKRPSDGIQKRKRGGAPGEGAKGYFRKSVYTFLNWAVDEGILFANPMVGSRKKKSTKAAKVDENESGRALPKAELGAVWQAADPETNFGRLVRFILLTGTRREEAAALDWRWIDRSAGIITIPDSATKMARAHDIPITQALAKVLDACPRTMSPLVFPAGRIGRGKKVQPGEERNSVRISGWSKLVPKLAAKSGVDFSLHDLRRSLRTHVRELGYDSDVARLLIGHVRGSLDARYDRSKLIEVRREAAEAYSALVAASAAESAHRVVPLQRATVPA